MKNSIYQKIRAQMLILVAVIAVFIAVIITVDFVFTRQTVLRVNSELGESAAADARQMLIEQSEAELMGVVEYRAALSDNYFDVIATDVTRMVYAAESLLELEYPALTEHEKMEMLRVLILDNILDSIRGTGGVYYGTEAGMLYYVDTLNMEIPVDTDMTGRPWYTSASAAGELIWTDIFDDAYGRGLSITCAMPYYAPDGTLVGVAGAGMVIQGLIELVIESQVGETGRAFVLNENGQIIIAEDIQADEDGNPIRENLLENPDESVRRAAERMLNGQSGIERVTFDGVERFLAFHALESMPWSLGIIIDIDEIIAPAHQIEESIQGMQQSAIDSVNRDRLVITVAAVAIIVLVFIVAAYISDKMAKGITTPISKLSDATNAIVDGDLSNEIDVDSEDELGVLAKNFMTMQESIREKMEAERNAHKARLEKEKSEAVADAMKESITYASKIQRNLLPQDHDMAAVFSDYSVIWKPRDIVGGDVYWVKQFNTGTVLCVADCTGHGTPGALLTTLVTSALESIVWEGNCDDTADIIWQLDQRLSAVLHVDSESETRRRIIDIDDGCDIAVMFVAADRSVQFSCANIPVFICDGETVVQHKGQRLFVGENKMKSSSEVNVLTIPANPENKYYIASDGLFDQIGGERGIQFGYDSFKKIILENHGEKQSVITAKVWDAYEQYRGVEAQRDDFELVAIQP